MLIYPAIDLRGGRVVRLTQGDYDRMTVYGDDPVGRGAGLCAGRGHRPARRRSGRREGRQPSEQHRHRAAVQAAAQRRGGRRHAHRRPT